MLSKRARPNQDQEVPKDKRLRYNVADLCLSSGISASRCQSVYEDAQACGARNVGDLARIGNQGKSKGNCSRDLLDAISEYTHHENLRQADEVRQALAQPAIPSAPAACPEA